MADQSTTTFALPPYATPEPEPEPEPSSAFVPCEPSDFFSASTNTATRCLNTDNSNGAAGVDFASTALWAVVLSVIGAVLFSGSALWWFRRHVRRRMRQRIRAALWDLVHEVQNGRMDASYLQRLLRNEINKEKPPVLYETLLSPDEDEKPQPLLHVSSLPSSKWKSLCPLAITPPYPLTDDPKKAYPNRTKTTTTTTTTTTWPSSLFGWKSRPSMQSHKARMNATFEETGTELGGVEKVDQRHALCLERGIDVVVMISMPHPDRPRHFPPPPVAKHFGVVEMPISMGSINTKFAEHILDPIEPLPHSRNERGKPCKGELSESLRSVRNEHRDARRRREEEREERVREWMDEPVDWFGLSPPRRPRPTPLVPASTIAGQST